jgi:hypothetical protein
MQTLEATSMRHRLLRTHVAALMLLAPMAATLVGPAQAQQRAIVADRAIQTIALNADHGLAAGSTLRVEVQASPDARAASVALGGSGIVVPLRQVSPGVYRGNYTVRRVDQIDPTLLMTASLTYGDRTITRAFNYPASFQALAAGAPRSAALIERFAMRPPNRMEPGRELQFRLHGAPGGDAWVDIPGVITGVDLAETRPGVYEGSYTIRRRDEPAAFERAVATLRSGNQRATARISMDREVAREREPAPRDNRAPQITDMAPAHGDRVAERGRTHISARLSDEGTGIDPQSVRLRIDGRDVTSDANVVANQLRYRRDLDPGRYTAEVTVRDLAGNATTKSWTFDVIDRERVGTAPAGVLPLEVISHVNNAVVDNSSGTLALQGRTVPNATVRVQVDTSPNPGGPNHRVLDQTIQADRNGVFSVNVTPSGYVIPGTRYDVRLTATHGNQSAEERLVLRRQG